MKVGDLVYVRGISSERGVVLAIDGRQVRCLWQDGDVSWCGTWMVEVIYESR